MKSLKVGLQLYSIRDEMEKSVEESLKTVKEMGYDYVEFAGYFGKTAEEIKSLLDRYDLKCISVHQSPDLFVSDGEPAVEYLKTIGAKYCAIPWYDASKLKGTDKWDETVKTFVKVGKLLKDNRIQLLYHNHDFEFKQFEGKFLLDWLYETLSPNIFAPEIDTCWVRYAGYDPVEYLKKYTGRISVVHLKDFVGGTSDSPVYELIGDDKKSDKNVDFKFVPLGRGIQDFQAIINASAEAGAEYVIVEQDQSYDIPSLEAVQISREYLKTLGI